MDQFPFFDKMHSLFLCLNLLMLLQCSHCRIAEELLAKEDRPAPAPPPALPPPPPLIPPSPSFPPPTTPPEPSAVQLSNYPATPVSTCFSGNRDKCPGETEPCAVIEENSLLCCDVNASTFAGIGNLLFNPKIINLHIINATLDSLDVSHIMWRRLLSISVTDGNIKSVVGEFKKNSPASCLNISKNGLTNITNRAFANLFNLTTLDISDNKLKGMPNFNGHHPGFALNIKGNKMLCKNVLEVLEQYKVRLNFIDINTTFCTSSKTFHWFNSTELVPIQQIEDIHDLKNSCPPKCSCDMVRVDLIPGKPATFSVGVDCSNRQFKQLPNTLPPNTIQLNVSNNNLTSLSQISEHPSYEHMRQLYADYNNIQSIVELEGTKFIDNFVMLSLKGNKLKSIPTYILSDTLDRNSFNTLQLGNNYLHCDCASAKILKFWLFDKSKHIPDFDTIYCDNTRGQGRVIDLSETVMCQQQRDWADYLYFIIALEVVLLLGLVTKVSYDYWKFKTVGYLPWPASKMPKLPCDWLCE